MSNYMKRAIKQAAAYNAHLNRQRREDFSVYYDMSTNVRDTCNSITQLQHNLLPPMHSSEVASRQLLRAGANMFPHLELLPQHAVPPLIGGSREAFGKTAFLKLNAFLGTIRESPWPCVNFQGHCFRLDYIWIEGSPFAKILEIFLTRMKVLQNSATYFARLISDLHERVGPASIAATVVISNLAMVALLF